MKISKSKKFMHNVKKTIKNNAPMILSCIGTAGTVATVVLTAKATFKAADVLKKLELQNEEIEFANKVKAVGPYYIPAATTCLVTVMCIFGSEILNKKRQMSIAGAYMTVDRLLKEYKQKATEVGGEELTKKIENEILKNKSELVDKNPYDGKKLYYEEYYGKYFEARPDEIKDAIYNLNRQLAYNFDVGLDEFYQSIGIKTETGLGWTGDYIRYEWDMGFWIEMYTEEAVLEDGLECSVIRFPLRPIANYLEYDCFY